MELIDLLTQIHDAYEGNNLPCDYGCSELLVDKMIQESKVIAPNKPICTVSDWIWIDFMFPKEKLDIFSNEGVHPSLVRSENIIFDEAERPNINTSVRSTWLKSFHNNCLFMTRNTSYILVGRGSRVSVSPELLGIIMS